jgi:hypothetical protein
MRLRRLVTSAAIFVFVTSAHAQVLTCATGTADQCNGVHFHVQAWNPETKGFTEIYGQNSFANVEACEAVRKHEMTVNESAIAHLSRTAPRLKAQATKYGPCHCDMTGVRSDPHFLDDEQRAAQMRRDREMKLAMLELLLDHELPLDSDLARAHISAPAARVRAPYWTRDVMLPELKGDHLLDPERVKLLETVIDGVRRPSTAGASLAPTDVRYDATLVAGGDAAAADVNPFIDAEMTRINTMLEGLASAEGDTGALLEASNDRIQVLTNLARVIESGGGRSRLSSRSKAAKSDSERLALIRALFGELVATHWAPQKVSDMVFTLPAEVNRDPVAVLRDTSGKFTNDQKRIALFAQLARSASLTDSEEIWLSGIADANLVP